MLPLSTKTGGHETSAHSITIQVV